MQGFKNKRSMEGRRREGRKRKREERKKKKQGDVVSKPGWSHVWK